MSNLDRVDILTPVGRLVSGDPFVANDKDANGNPLLIKSGPNAGQPTVNYYVAIAIAKTDAGYNDLWAQIHGEGRKGFPQLFDAAGQCLNPAFSWKITDGDSQVPNSNNNKPCDREGWPGNWILHFSGSFAPKCYTAGGAELIVDPNAIKRGYFIRVSGSVKSNGNAQKPGVYLNHSMIELVAYGEEIKSGPTGDQVFGGAPVTGALPAGASATPLAPTTTIATPGAPAPAASATPAMAAPATVQTQAAPAPAASGPGIAAPAPDILAPKTYLVDGANYTAEQLTASGWSAEQIAALG